jgi:H/ACA ribonucleoprotein complex non-core subunit NAF1
MDIRSPKRIRLEGPLADDEDVLQDDSDFYSESGSPEKIHQANNHSIVISEESKVVQPVLFDKPVSTSPITREPSVVLNSIPGLGNGESEPSRPPKREHGEVEDDSGDDDLYGGEMQNRDIIQEAVVQPPSEAVDELGLTPESTADPETEPLPTQDLSEPIIDDIAILVEQPVTLPDVPKVVINNGVEESAVGGALESAKAQLDPEFVAAAEANKSDGNAEWRFDSSDAESSSDSSDSSSDDSDEDSDDEEGILLDPEEQARILMQEVADGDEGGVTEGPLKTANEQTEQFVAKPDIIITDDMRVLELGSVDKIVSNLAVIKANTSGEYRVLEAGSLLCLENRIVIGAISETLGRVQEPRYTVGFPSAQALEDDGIAVGTKIFYVEPHSTFVFTQPLRLAKGTDASNVHDEEVAEEELEYSDDEKEAEVKKAAKQAKKDAREGREVNNKPPPTGPSNRGRGAANIPTGPRGHNKPPPVQRKSHPDSNPDPGYSAPISYDDDDDEEMYRPLKRPDNLHEMMNAGPPPPAGPMRGRGGFGGRGGRGKGRGRGDFQDRGRGGFSNRGGGRGGQKNWKDQGGSDRGSERDFSAAWQKPTGRQSKSPQPPREPKGQQQHQHQNQQQQQHQNQQHQNQQHQNSSPHSSQNQQSKHSKKQQKHQSKQQDQNQRQYRQNDPVPAPSQPPQQQYGYQAQQPPAQQYPQVLPPPKQYSQAPAAQQYSGYAAPPPQPQQVQSNMPVSNLPAGAHVNPAFYMLQQLAQGQISAPSPPPPPQQQQYNPAAALGGVNLQQLQQLAALLQSQQQQQSAPAAPPPPPVQNQQQYAGWTGYAPPQQQQYQQAPPAPARNDDAEARAAQERLNAMINSFRPTDPRR